jgi:hypothetical protein
MKQLILMFVICLPFAQLGGQPVRAQTGSLPREAVCVNLGGDGVSLLIWSAAEIAEWERNTGRPVTRAHPATGTCFDPAGLMLLGGRGDPEYWTYDCYLDEDGWVGPMWSIRIYHLPGAERAAVSPETGDCPWPPAALYGTRSMVERAGAIAVYLSQLEMTNEMDLLHAWLHPDAQAMVPAVAMAGWYEAEWLPRGPGPLLVDEVRFVNWVWPVTGELYPNTAEITYHQAFGDGSVVEDTAHLVQVEQGGWRWFFGRDQAFIEDVIATHGETP